MHIVRPLAITFSFLLLAACAGCQTPLLAPRVAGAHELRATLHRVADEIEIELSAMPDGGKSAEQFRHAWTSRRASLAALVHYAQSLAAIAQAGRDGQAAAAAVADAVEQALALAGFTQVPGLAALPGVTAHLIALRAAANLREAMQHAQPLMDALAEHLAKDITALEAIVQLAHAAARLRITADHSGTLSLRADIQTQLQRAASSNDVALGNQLTTMLLGTEPAYQRYQRQIETCDEQATRLRKLLREAGARVVAGVGG